MFRRFARRLPNTVVSGIRRRLEPNTLAEGEVAPEWFLLGSDGEWHGSSRNESTWSVLVFYPQDDTPGCTSQLQDFERHWTAFQDLGCRVYGINPGTEQSHAAFAERLGLSFPLLTDGGRQVAKNYCAVWSPPLAGPRILRTVYLINPLGKIRLANRGAPSIPAILRSITALQQATRYGM